MDVFWKRASLRLIGCIWRFSVCRISVVSRILGISWRGVPCLYCLSICKQWFVPCIGRWRVPVIFYTNVQPTDDPRRLQSSWRIGHSFDTRNTYVLPIRWQAAQKVTNGWNGQRGNGKWKAVVFCAWDRNFAVIHIDAIECSAFELLIKHSLQIVLNALIPRWTRGQCRYFDLEHHFNISPSTVNDTEILLNANRKATHFSKIDIALSSDSYSDIVCTRDAIYYEGVISDYNKTNQFSNSIVYCLILSSSFWASDGENTRLSKYSLKR